MPADPIVNAVSDWREALPVLAGTIAMLREPHPADAVPLVSLLSMADAPAFAFDVHVSGATIHQFIDAAIHDRRAGRAFTYAITAETPHSIAGLMQVRRLDSAFETAEWDCTITPSLRGTGIFIDAARAMGSFLFGVVGARRLEARVLQRNGRGNGAMRKLGAVQEGVLRRAVRHGHEYVDQVLWSVLSDDWADRRPAKGSVH
jgi:RimJ/RimL family protein N-acetyltransferase